MSDRMLRRGSTMILVVSMLVLLVLIAAAFVSRAQSGRVLASAQQGVASQSDRIGPIANAVADEIALSLFVRPVDGRDSQLVTTGRASSAVPRLVPSESSIRYGVDVFDRINNRTLEYGPDGIIDGYNFAPYEVRPWTNWPDLYGTGTEANPLGNPGFGDCRWLRSTEPVRVAYRARLGSMSDHRGVSFSHWSHLSWIPTANNGWRLVTDISDVTLNTLTDVAPSAAPVDFFPSTPRRWGLEIPYEQWLPSVSPMGLTSDGATNEWIGTTFEPIPLAPIPPYPNLSTQQGQAARRFQQLAFGDSPAANPVGGWFSSEHGSKVGDPKSALPNFLRLKWFGPRTDEFVHDSPRNIITRTLCDTDGDGFTDSFWFLAPSSIDRSVRHVVGVSVVDNSALLNVNVATRFNPLNTGGKTPADLALVGHAIRPDPANPPSSEADPNPLPAYPDAPSALNALPSGLFRSEFLLPLNPHLYEVAAPPFSRRLASSSLPNSRVGFLDSDFNAAGSQSYERILPEPPPLQRFLVQFRPQQYDGALAGVQIPPAPAPFGSNPTVLSELGVVGWGGMSGSAQALAPFPNLLLSDLERTVYFKAMANGGEVDNWFNRSPLNDVGFAEEQALGYGDLLVGLGLSGNPTIRNSSNPEVRLDPFTMADEYELRAHHGNNSASLRSRLERAVESEFGVGAVPESQPVNLTSQTLRSSLVREETSEFHDQLDARQLLYDNRRKLTTVSGARNEMMPPWLWTVPPPNWPTDPVGMRYFDFHRVPTPAYMQTLLQNESERSRFLQWNKKTDLNAELDVDNADRLAINGFQQVLASRIIRVLQRSLIQDDCSIGGSQFSGLRDMDSVVSVFGRLPPPADHPDYIGATPPFPYNKHAIREAQQAVLSWTANILAALDGRRKFRGNTVVEYVDAPLHPDFGLIIPPDNPSVPSGVSVPSGSLCFTGQEKHPFIVQVFMAVVYPKSGVLSGDGGQTQGGNNYVCYNPTQSESAVDGTGARVVLAVQIANPYNTPIDLTPFTLRAFGQNFLFSLPSPGWAYHIASPATPSLPILGPCTPEGPCTAVVFAIPKSLGKIGEDWRDDFFRAHMLDFLDLTHPWLNPSIANNQPPATAIFPTKLRDELLAAVTAASSGPVFPPNGADLFESSLTPYADSLLFNASKPSEGEAVADAGSDSWAVKPKYYHDKFFPPSSNPNAPPEDEDCEPETLTQQQLADIGVQLLRNIPNPSGGSAFSQVVDRYPDPNVPLAEGDQGQTWLCALKYLFRRPPVDVDGTSRGSSRGVPPQFVQPEQGDAEGRFAHVDIRQKDYLMSWIRVARPFTYDVNGDGKLTENESSPRFVFAHDLGPDLPTVSTGQDKPVRYITRDGDEARFGSTAFGLEDLRDKADDPSTIASWCNRPYVSPLGKNNCPTDRLQVRFSKPTNFTLRTFLVGDSRRYPRFDEAPPPGQIIDGDTGAFWPSDGGPKPFWSSQPCSPPTQRNVVDPPKFFTSPFSLAQRDGPFEQIAEIFDVPVWGPVLKLEGSNWVVKRTFGEILVNAQSVNGSAQPPAGLSGEALTRWLGDPENSRNPGFPRFGDDDPASDPTRYDPARFQFRRVGAQAIPMISSSRPALPVEDQQDSSISGQQFDPWAQTPTQYNDTSGLSPTVPNGAVPWLPAGASILDGFTLDGAGMPRKDLRGSSPNLPPDNLAQPSEVMAAEQRRLRLAGGFQGVLTPGLLNINTAPLEVLRALPNMQYLSYMYSPTVALVPEDPGFPNRWYNYDEGGPDEAVKVNFPETIINSRDRYFPDAAVLENANSNVVTTKPLPGPKYDDRGGSLFHLGTRQERGFVSVGELAILDRAYQDGNPPGSDPREILPFDFDPAAPARLSWQFLKSWGIDFAGNDPYRTNRTNNAPLTGDDYGWYARANAHSAQLATERLAFNTLWPSFPPILASAKTAGDQTERNALLKGIANLVTTRSDVFTVYLKIRSVAQNQQTGKWDATDPTTLIDESRYLMVIDRSNVDRPSDEPRILMFERVDE